MLSEGVEPAADPHWLGDTDLPGTQRAVLGPEHPRAVGRPGDAAVVVATRGAEPADRPGLEIEQLQAALTIVEGHPPPVGRGDTASAEVQLTGVGWDLEQPRLTTGPVADPPPAGQHVVADQVDDALGIDRDHLAVGEQRRTTVLRREHVAPARPPADQPAGPVLQVHLQGQLLHRTNRGPVGLDPLHLRQGRAGCREGRRHAPQLVGTRAAEHLLVLQRQLHDLASEIAWHHVRAGAGKPDDDDAPGPGDELHHRIVGGALGQPAERDLARVQLDPRQLAVAGGAVQDGAGRRG